MIEEFAQMLAGLAGLAVNPWSYWIVIVLRLMIAGTVFLGGVSVMAMFAIWLERKVAGHMQSRVGPMHTGAWHGWAQSIADAIKLFLKEDLRPEGADVFLFRLAPYLAFIPVFTALLALPFGPQFVFDGSLNIGVLFLLAVLSVEVMGVILAGWASNSKWSIYGAMREACQMVSYEIPLGISIICGVLAAGTLSLVELGYLQGGGVWDWFVFHNPFLFVAFVLYFIASLASNKRAPFDLPEADSELVAGFHTEYSGLRFSFFFFAEYAAMFVIGGIQAGLFLGGWNSPLGVFDPVYLALGYDPVVAGHAYFAGQVVGGVTEQATALGVGGGWVTMPPVLAMLAINIYCAIWFVLKIMTIIFVQMWLRWTLPRIRIDQVLYACVKVLLPLSLVTLVGAAVWIALVPQPAGVQVDGQMVMRLGHLIGSVPTLQLLTQVALTALGGLIVLAIMAVVAWAFIHRNRQMYKTLFADVMPVGRDVAFTVTRKDDQAANPVLASGNAGK